jgi:thioredoxin-dependent peroxiredoxin
MIAIGISRACPSGASASNPTARGPLLTFRFSEICARLTPKPQINIRIPQTTAHADLRNNALRYRIDLKETPMNINDKAPEFTLPDQNGNPVALKNLRGKTVILFFYPKADTPGCTIEVCSFRDSYKQLEKTGAVLLGISGDTPEAQKKFADKFHFSYTLLADAGKKIAAAYGVMKEKNMYGKKVMGIARTTFVIGPDGKIAHIFEKVKPEGHAEEVLKYLKQAA